MKKSDLPCLAPFRQPMIRSDGSLTVCNYDLGLSLKLGNLADSSFEDLWYGTEIQALRLAHIRGQGLPDKCRKCKPDLVLPRNQVLKFLRLCGMEHEAWPFLRRIREPIKLLLVNPPVSEKAPYKMTVTLGLGSLAAFVRDRYEVRIVNMPHQNLSCEEIAGMADSEGFNVVGITGMTYQARSGLRLARTLKQSDYSRKVFFGGPFASLAWQEIMSEPCVDGVALCEGEQTLLDLLQELEKPHPELSTVKGMVVRGAEDNCIVTAERPLLPPEQIPAPARDLMPTHGFIPDDRAFEFEHGAVSAVMMFSRGCPGECVFCASPAMWHRKVSFRYLDSVIAEIRTIIDTYGVRNFVIDDDAFTVSREKVMEFCSRVISENLDISWRCNTKVTLVDREMFDLMKKAGCVKVTYGVESGNDQILALLKKGFTVADVKRAFALNRECALPAGMLMIIGHPLETPETVTDSLNLVREIAPDAGSDFQIMQPHPGTELREVLAKQTGRIVSNDWDEYFSDNITYLPEGFTPGEFVELCRTATGRPVKYAGDDYRLQKTIHNRNILRIEIPPQHWEYGFFDLWQPHYWQGDATCSSGYTHTLGRDHGEINYVFECLEEPARFRKIRISARLCSQDSATGSRVEFFLNSQLLGKADLGVKSPEGELRIVRSILDSGMLKKGRNELKLLVPKGERGLSILFRPLPGQPGMETPILVELLEGNAQSQISRISEQHIKPPFKPIPLLILDTANFCDLSCIMCPLGNESGREQHIMEWPLLEKILIELTAYEFKLADAVLPFWNGEPLIYPYFSEMISFLSRPGKKSFNCLVLHTNARNLNRTISSLMLESELFGSITFSIDAAMPGTYDRIRRGGDLEKTEANIRDFLELRKHISGVVPVVSVQFLVLPDNHHETMGFVERWLGIFSGLGIARPSIVWDDFEPVRTDAIFLKRTTAYPGVCQPDLDRLHLEAVKKLGLVGTETDVSVRNDEFRPDRDHCAIRMPCVGLFENLGVRNDGLVSACCRDFKAVNSIGSVWENTLLELWESEKLASQRSAHFEGRFDDVPLCGSCLNQPNHRLNDEEIKRWTEYIRR
ncbi:MAG: radical SAM protein [Candidatus Wallbacteria bacterium]|nr:radical SAM protein [Candidatus Wallbacteria bacterium]